MWHALKQLFTDLFSTLAYAFVLVWTHSIALATGVAVGLALLQFGASLLRGRKPNFMQWASLALVLVLGGASLLLNDPRLVMIKPSIAHFAIAVVMLRRNWMTQYVPEAARARLGERVFERWGYAWAAFMVLLGCVNLAVAAHGDIAWWGASMLALGVAKLLFFAVQSLSLRLLGRRLSREALSVAETPPSRT